MENLKHFRSYVILYIVALEARSRASVGSNKLQWKTPGRFVSPTAPGELQWIVYEWDGVPNISYTLVFGYVSSRLYT